LAVARDGHDRRHIKDQYVKGRKRSSMYVFDDELREGFRRGHSLVVFDHWKRVQRLPYLAAAFARLSEATGAREPFALWGRN
jgi:hypothetical protein